MRERSRDESVRRGGRAAGGPGRLSRLTVGERPAEVKEVERKAQSEGDCLVQDGQVRGGREWRVRKARPPLPADAATARVRPVGRLIRHGVPTGPPRGTQFWPGWRLTRLRAGRMLRAPCAPQDTCGVGVRERRASPPASPQCLRGGHYMSAFVDEYMAWLKAKNPAEPEFHQAAMEVAESLEVVLEQEPEVPRGARSSSASSEPERVDHVPRAVDRRQGRGPASTAASASR